MKRKYHYEYGVICLGSCLTTSRELHLASEGKRLLEKIWGIGMTIKKVRVYE